MWVVAIWSERSETSYRFICRTEDECDEFCDLVDETPGYSIGDICILNEVKAFPREMYA